MKCFPFNFWTLQPGWLWGSHTQRCPVNFSKVVLTETHWKPTSTLWSDADPKAFHGPATFNLWFLFSLISISFSPFSSNSVPDMLGNNTSNPVGLELAVLLESPWVQIPRTSLASALTYFSENATEKSSWNPLFHVSVRLLLAPVNMPHGDFPQPLRRACRDFTVFLQEKKKESKTQKFSIKSYKDAVFLGSTCFQKLFKDWACLSFH